MLKTPDTTKGYEQHVALQALKAARSQQFELIDGPVGISARLVFTRPHSMFAASYGASRLWHDSKPDIDNAVKAIFDGIGQSGAVWTDDARISRLQVEAFYGAVQVRFDHISEPAGAWLRVEKLKQPG